MKKLYLYFLVALFLIVAVVAAYTLFGSGSSGSESLTAFDNEPVPASLMQQLLIPDDVSAAIGRGLAIETAKNISGPALTLNGKPEILYVGGEFCPYCAIDRWSLAIALSRFGNFSGLRYMTSGAEDIYPSTPTFTFSNSTYTSSYVAFVAKELYGNKLVGGSYEKLQQLTSSEQAIMQAFNTRGSLPFLDMANKSAQVGANYNDLTILANKNWSTIANELHNSSSVTALAVVGSANLLTAHICRINNNVPASVCNQTYIQNIQSALK